MEKKICKSFFCSPVNWRFCD